MHLLISIPVVTTAGFGGLHGRYLIRGIIIGVLQIVSKMSTFGALEPGYGAWRATFYQPTVHRGFHGLTSI
jgi:hypothetical protein